MESNNLTLLINRYKRIVEQNVDGKLDKKEDAIRKDIITELQDNPKGIIISKEKVIRFTTKDIDDDWEWFFDMILYNNDGLTFPELLKKDYYQQQEYYEDEGVIIKNNLTITDLEGNKL